MRIGVDSGGTFTDFAWLRDGRLQALKLPSTPADPAAAVIAGLEQILAGLPQRPAELEVVHGTTVATNALLTRAGARVALLTTAGMEDVLAIGRQDRPKLYDLHPTLPPPLVPDELRLGVQERLGADGSMLIELTDAEARRVAAQAAALNPQAIAVCLLHSYAWPEHEQRLGAALRAAMPNVPVFLSSAVDPQPREYERTSTTVLHAYLSAAVGHYLRELERRLPQGTRLRILTSSGGTATVEQALARPADLVLSGPAGGALATAELAQRTELREFIGLDMGGTSTDVCLGWGGVVAEDTGRDVDGLPLRVPRLAVHTVGAGGGSIARAGLGGVLLVGPASAGALPGPAAYGQGGPPTVTDANVVLGRIQQQLTGAANWLSIDAGLAQRAVAELAVELELVADDTARGILAIADQRMAQAAAAVSQQRGYDPRQCVLIPFGGAGPLHACSIAEQLGIRRILVPPLAGVLSAVGALEAAPRRDATATVLQTLEDWPPDSRREMCAKLRSELTAELGSRVSLRFALHCHYAGQSFELAVPLRSPGESTARLTARFGREHARAYGYKRADHPVEVVTLQATATGLGMDLSGIGADDGLPSPGSTGLGPQVIAARTTTVYAAAGWSWRVDAAGLLWLDLAESAG